MSIISTHTAHHCFAGVLQHLTVMPAPCQLDITADCFGAQQASLEHASLTAEAQVLRYDYRHIRNSSYADRSACVRGGERL